MAVITTTEGTSIVTAQQVLADITAIFINVFGVSPDTTTGNPTNQFIQELTNFIVSFQNQLALTNSTLYNPNVAQSIFLDALCGMMNLNRANSSATKVLCTLSGIPYLNIPANSIIINPQTGDQFYNPSSVTLDASGSAANVPFLCTVKGAIQAPANSVTQIQQNLAGWSQVNNPAVGIVGSDTQTDNSLRNTRRYGLATQSTGWFEAINSALTNFMVQNGTTIDSNSGYKYILGYYVVVNETGASILLRHDGTNMVLPHSMYITVYSPSYLYNGAVQNTTNAGYLAGILLNIKNGGCQTQNIQTGTQAFSIDYTSTKWVNALPINIKFDSPTPVPVQFNLTVQQFSNTLNALDLTANIQKAILSQFYNGYNSIPPILMVQSISSNAFIGAIVNTVGNINISSITIQTVTAGTPAATLPAMSPIYIYTLSSANILVTLV